MVKIDLLEEELKGNWLAKPRPVKIDREAIRAKHRAAHLRKVAETEKKSKRDDGQG
jgi:hypothetical protein